MFCNLHRTLEFRYLPCEHSGEARSVSEGFSTFIDSIFLIWNISKLLSFGRAGYGTWWIAIFVGDSRSTLCLTVEIWPRRSSHIDWNGLSILANTFWYIEFAPGVTVDSRQSICLLSWGVIDDKSLSVFTVLMTLGSDWSFGSKLYGAPVLTIVDMSSSRRSNTLCFLVRFFFVDVFGNENKNGWLRKF